MSVPSTPGCDRRPTTDQMSLEELRQEFIHQKLTQFHLHAEAESLKSRIENLRSESVRLQQNAEIEEEHAANQLFRRLDGAERDVRKHQQLLKEEEEAMNNLRGQIREVRLQQTNVENQVEQQEDYLLVRLQKKLLEVANKKSELERELLTERQRYLEVLVSQLAVLRGVEDGASASVLSSGTAEEGNNPLQEDGANNVSASQPVAETSAGANATAIIDDSAGEPTPPQGSPSGRGQFDAATHNKVVQLEQRLNKLLAQQAQAMQESAETERRCAELSKKLTDIQNATFLDRARAAKLKEELYQARSKLSDLENASADVTSFYEENSSFSTPSRSLDQSTLIANASQSLKERTKELLSAAPPPNSST